MGTRWGMHTWEQVLMRDCNLGVACAGAEEQGENRSGGGRPGGEAGGRRPQTSYATHCYIQGLSAVQGKTEVE